MTTLVLVRHAETVAHAENRYTGLRDVDLTDTGRRQAQHLADWAAADRLDALWSSPLPRCLKTLQPSADTTGLPIQVDERLRELDFGIVDGLTAAEARQRHPEVMEAFWRDPVANHFPGGEPPEQATDRAMAALRSIATAHPDSRVMVVAHSTLLRLALCRMLGIPASRYRAAFPYLDNCARTEVRVRDGQFALLCYNVPVQTSDRLVGEEAL